MNVNSAAQASATYQPTTKAAGRAADSASSASSAKAQSVPVDTVQLSKAGLAAQKADAQGTNPSAADETSVAPTKSLVYGVLGLERPDPPQEDQKGQNQNQSQNQNEYYSAGRWVSAAATAGAIVSMLI